jgi:hypothetical protein
VLSNWYYFIQLDSILKIDHLFGSTTKIDGLTQGVDQGVKIAHIEVLNLNDESNVVLKTQAPLDLQIERL